jgi:transposase-like protein
MAARRERWSGIIERAEASGMSIRQFCEKHDVDEGQFYHWRHRLELEAAKSESTSSAASGFVLVQPAPETRPEVTERTEAAALELALDRGWRLRIPRGVDEATLRAVLAALR